MKNVDLHLHTCFSDGTYTPEELVGEVLKNDLAAIAVVDHDTVDGIAPTLEAAKSQDLEIIPGIELTAQYEGNEIHILGYLLEYNNKALRKKLSALKVNRLERMHKILGKLRELDVWLDAEDVFALSQQGTVGRLHIARAMVNKGIVGSTQEAFQRYIGDKSPAYVLGFRYSPEEAIALIRDFGGIAVLAHPYTVTRDELIPQFVTWGLQGLEAYYPEHNQSQINFYLRLAQQYHLLVTGGSDCHGSAKPEARLGSFKIPYILVEKLKEVQRLAHAK